jgi:hypothetical protein
MAAGYRLLAHDLCLIRPVRDTVEILAVPTTIRLGLGLVAALGWDTVLTEQARAGTEIHPFTAPEVLAALVAGDYRVQRTAAGRELKVELFAQDMTRWFGVETSTTAVARAVAVPRFRPDAELALEPASQTAGDLAAHVVWGPRSGYPNFLDYPLPPPPEERPATAEVLTAVAALPATRLTFGADVAANRRFLRSDASLLRRHLETCPA